MNNLELIPDLADTATGTALVEEILRMQAIIQYGIVRRAAADIEIDGVHIAEGDWVVARWPRRTVTRPGIRARTRWTPRSRNRRT